MKIKKSLFLMLIASIFSCIDKDDQGKKEGSELSDEQEWIASQMQERYLWNDEIPENLDGKLNTVDFFYEMLSKKDGKHGDNFGYYYSYIEENKNKSKALDLTNSYGFEFAYMGDPVKVGKEEVYLMRILYVVPGSPAFDAGVKRGDWFYAFGDRSGKQLIKITHYQTTMFDNGSGLSLYKCSLIVEDGKEPQIFIPEDLENKPYVIESSRALPQEPFLLSDVIDLDGEPIGYAVFNSFFDGENTEMLNQLQADLTVLRDAGVRRMILDLRYNGGGYLSTMQELCSNLTPQSQSKVLCHLVDNKGAKLAYSFKGRNNMNIEELTVLTSPFTASASEALIVCLRPYIKVNVIGTTTEGKDVASTIIESDEYNWDLHPIIAFLTDKNGKGDYFNGIPPTHYGEINDLFLSEEHQIYLPLGDPNELLLKAALNLYSGRSMNFTSKSNQSKTIVLDKSSLDKKGYKDLIVDCQ